VYSGSGQQYRDNWDAIFGKKTERAPEEPPEPDCDCPCYEHEANCPLLPPPSSTVPSR
jgi:hypothetical protein